jgi:hypothetical protein
MAGSTGAAPGPHGSSATAGHEGGAKPSATRALTPPHAATVGYAFRAGTSVTKARFAPLTASLSGIQADVTYLAVTAHSKPVADVAVYSFRPGQAKSALFRGQILRQMVSAAAIGGKIRLNTVGGHEFAIAGRSAVAVGAFKGAAAVVILGRTGNNSLALATGAAVAYFTQR